jgi:hypothetical protein
VGFPAPAPSSKRPLQVVEAHQPSPWVEFDSDCIETNLLAPGRLTATERQPFTGHLPHLLPLADADRSEGAQIVAPTVPPRAARRSATFTRGASGRDPRLDFAEDQAAIVRHDHVELSMAGAEIRVEHLEASRLEMTPREIFAKGAHQPSRVRLSHATTVRISGLHVGDGRDEAAQPFYGLAQPV